MKARLVVLISGSGSNLQTLIDAAAAGTLAAEIVAVVSNRQRAFGLERAQRVGIPTAVHRLKPLLQQGRSRRDYDVELAQIVQQHEPDWVVLAGWMHILSDAFLRHFPNCVINLHPALPGRFPGAHAIEEAFAAYQRGDVDQTGVMVHLVPDERVDEGPVLGQIAVPILPTDTLDALAERMHQAEHKLLVQTLARLIHAG